MRSFAHWTPRYVFDRMVWEAHQRLHPTWPWIVPQAATLLDGVLDADKDVGLEWGSGRSTAWLAKRPVGAAARRRGCGQRIRERGRRVSDASLQFALIDGAERENRALRVLPKLAAGAVLVIDNINWYLDHPTRSAASRAGQGPLNALWAKFAVEVRGWRCIWLSQGVTDTALWFKA